MKLPIAAAVFTMALFGSAVAQKSPMPKVFTVQGKVQFDVPKGYPSKVWISRDNFDGKLQLVDSVELGPDLTYSFRIKQDHPGVYHLNVLNWDRISFWSDADVKVESRGYDTSRYKIKIPHYYHVEGSSDNNFINMTDLNNTMQYRRYVEEYNEEYAAKKLKDSGGDSTWFTYLKTRPRYNRLEDETALRAKTLQTMYKDRPVLIYALRNAGNPEDTARYNATMAQLDHLLKLYPWLTEAANLKATITKNRDAALQLKPGKPVPKIAYPDSSGTLQGHEKYRGKYLLIDFWASWCGPCRQSVPKIKELYANYKDKGFAVLSISIDTDKKAWEKAVKEENMPWEQLLSNDKSKTLADFQFAGIPTLYLIDPNGNIVKKYTGYSPDTEADIKKQIESGKPAEEKKVIRATMM